MYLQLVSLMVTVAKAIEKFKSLSWRGLLRATVKNSESSSRLSPIIMIAEHIRDVPDGLNISTGLISEKSSSIYILLYHIDLTIGHTTTLVVLLLPVAVPGMVLTRTMMGRSNGSSTTTQISSITISSIVTFSDIV